MRLHSEGLLQLEKKMKNRKKLAQINEKLREMQIETTGIKAGTFKENFENPNNREKKFKLFPFIFCIACDRHALVVGTFFERKFRSYDFSCL